MDNPEQPLFNKPRDVPGIKRNDHTRSSSVHDGLTLDTLPLSSFRGGFSCVSR